MTHNAPCIHQNKGQGSVFYRLRSGPFEGPAIVIPPALPEDTYSRPRRSPGRDQLFQEISNTDDGNFTEANHIERVFVAADDCIHPGGTGAF